MEEKATMLTERTIDGLHAYLYELTRQNISEKHYSSIFDIGCGTGAWLERVKMLGFGRLVGIDHEQPPPVQGLDLQRHDVNQDIPRDLGQFDFITCIEVIEHIENIGNLLDLIQKTLKHGGMALITTPNIESLRARMRALVTGKIPSFDNKSDPTHLCPILYDPLQRMLRRRGLNIDAVYQYPNDKSKTLLFTRYVGAITFASNVLRAFFPDEFYGDIVVYRISHT